MRMKKRLLCIVIVIVMTLGGCQSASEDFLAYKDTEGSLSTAVDNQITEGEFFAKNLAIITDKENTGGDEELTSGASLLVNVTDNKVIYADHVYDKLYPASLTKLMTALIVLQKGEMTDTVTISYNASHITEIGAKTCGFAEGDKISLEALLNSMLIYSGNDAAIAVAEHVGGSVEAFVQMMNEEAVKIGAVHSNFVNPNGLHDDNQYTTAYDLYLVFNELLKFDTFREIVNQASYKAEYTDEDGNAKDKTFTSTNQYLEGEAALDPGFTVIGGKTGTTSMAGNCLILLVKDSNDKEYISIVLKASDKEALYKQMTYLLSKAEE